MPASNLIPNPKLLLSALILGLIPTLPATAQDALGDGHALDGNLSTRGTRNDATSTGGLRPGQTNSGALTNPNIRLQLSTNSDFRAQNLATPSAFQYSGGLYNNPWYWQHAGSLETEMMTGGMGDGGVGSWYFAGDNGLYSPAFSGMRQDSSDRVKAGANLSAIDSLNRISPSYIPPGQPGNVLQSPGESSPSDYSYPWEYTIGGQSPFLRDARRGESMRSDFSQRDLDGEPRVVGSGITAGQQMIKYTASNLRGLGAVFPGAMPGDRGLTQFDVLRSDEDNRKGRLTMQPGAAYQTRFSPDLLTRDRVNRRMNPATIPGESPQIEDTLEKMAKRYKQLNPGADNATLVNQLDQDYAQIQQDIAQFQIKPRLDRLAELEAMASKPEEDEEDATAPGVGTLTPRDSDEGEPGEVDEAGNTKRRVNYGDMGLVLQHGQRVASLATGDQTRFDDLLLGGQNKLAKGEYFWAEKRFQRALRFMPGHPLATAGLAHSQMGAGLHLTAALVLKSLLGFQPEMIDVVYDPGLLPKPDDLEDSITELKRRLTMGKDLDDYGFLLAYIGHQLDRPELIRTGLDAMARSNQDHVFNDLLQRIWLPQKEVTLPELNLPIPIKQIDAEVEEAEAPVEGEGLIDDE
jgi:hypothetical protein